MPTLNWIGKDKVMTHHLDVPCHVLDHKYGFRASNPSDKTPTDSGNLIIHGDNLLALKALLPQYEGRVKCIYIDPPYNTGNEKWVYNDNVNDPRIRKWLGEVVGVEGEDLSRHDKWLCMMYPRLQLLRQLLSEDGVIFISIDDNEYVHLKLICDEIFGTHNIIATLVWDLGTGTTAGHFTRGHEYVLCYAKNKCSISNFRNTKENQFIRHGALKKISKKNPPVEITFPAGFPYTGKDKIFIGEIGDSEKEYIISPKMEFKNGQLVEPTTIRAGFAMRRQIEDFIKGNEVFDTKGQRVVGFHFNSNGILFYEKEKTIVNPRTVLNNASSTKAGTSELKLIFGASPFEFPKPQILIQYFLELATEKNAIILDSFAGSGTTAHAVMELNKKDGGNRRFILIELMDYADSITAERVKRVAQGYGTGNKHVEGLGGEFDFYELGASIFNEDGNLNEDIGKQRIREYIYYSETRQALTRAYNDGEYLLDTVNNVSYYLYYEKDALCALTHDTLNIITQKSESYIVYADTCSISKDWLTEHNITFKQIPRDIRRF